MRKRLRLSLLLSLYLGMAPTRANADEETQLRVVILDVNDFNEESSFRDEELDADLLKAGEELDKFFNDNYNVTPTFLYTRKDTSSTALRKWLPDYFNTTQKTIMLFFILTHGRGFHSNAKTSYNSELYLATSDSSFDSMYDYGLKARAELLSSFKMLPNGSSVFLFIDACEASSIESGGLALDLDADKNHRMMILAASKAQRKSYKARFTRTLQKIWEEPHKPESECTKERDVDTVVTNRMDALFPVKVPTNERQEIKLVRAYTQDFCLESFAADQSLLLVGNTSVDAMDVSWRRDTELSFSSPKPVKPQELEAFKLLRTSYRLHTKVPSFEDTAAVDLEKGNSVRLVIPAVTGAAADISKIGGKSLIVASNLGASATAIDSLKSQVRDELSKRVSEEVSRTNKTKILIAKNEAQLQEAKSEQDSANQELAAARGKFEKAKQELATCCRHTINGIQIMDDKEMAEKKREVDLVREHEKAVAGTLKTLDSERAHAELLVAQANVELAHQESKVQAARTAFSGFQDSVEMYDKIEKAKHETQEQFASRLANPLWSVSRADRGITIQIPDVPAEIPNDLSVAFQNLKVQVETQIPATALIEVEAYSNSGDLERSALLANSVARILNQGPAEPNEHVSVVARGYGKTPTLVGDGSVKHLPNGLRIVISSPSIGYPARTVNLPNSTSAKPSSARATKNSESATKPPSLTKPTSQRALGTDRVGPSDCVTVDLEKYVFSPDERRVVMEAAAGLSMLVRMGAPSTPNSMSFDFLDIFPESRCTRNKVIISSNAVENSGAECSDEYPAQQGSVKAVAIKFPVSIKGKLTSTSERVGISFTDITLSPTLELLDVTDGSIGVEPVAKIDMLVTNGRPELRVLGTGRFCVRIIYPTLEPAR
jgi:hypothetical protein